MTLRIKPATAENFTDLEELFGPNGAWSGCRCMWNRQTNAEFQESNYEPNRKLLRRAIEQGHEYVLLAYDGELPVGWVALAPTAEYSRLQRSPLTKPVGDQPVWSIVCFVVAKEHRGRGVASALLEAAVARAWQLGADRVEGYPVDAESGRVPNDAWQGWLLVPGFRLHRGRPSEASAPKKLGPEVANPQPDTPPRTS
jgi:GNAT superfamily N-acetyltransferase